MRENIEAGMEKRGWTLFRGTTWEDSEGATLEDLAKREADSVFFC